MTAIQFSVVLWATSHATDYCRLACDLFIFMECASPAVITLHAKEMFTRMSATGKPEYSDLIMEKSIGHTRKHMGKMYRKGNKKKFEHVCEEIPHLPNNKNVKQDLRNKQFGGKTSLSKRYDWLTPKSPLIKGYDLIHNQIQLWHHTNKPIIKHTGQPNPVYADQKSFD